jgi:hypothetical protein
MPSHAPSLRPAGRVEPFTFIMDENMRTPSMQAIPTAPPETGGFLQFRSCAFRYYEPESGHYLENPCTSATATTTTTTTTTEPSEIQFQLGESVQLFHPFPDSMGVGPSGTGPGAEGEDPFNPREEDDGGERYDHSIPCPSSPHLSFSGTSSETGSFGATSSPSPLAYFPPTSSAGWDTMQIMQFFWEGYPSYPGEC